MTAPSRSFVFLSLLCFALADVRDGIGPFLGVWLQGQGWTADAIGIAMTVGGIAGMLFTSAAGALADRTRKKRLVLALAVCGMTLACGLLFIWTWPPLVWASKFVQGATSAVMAPTLAAITLGMAGQRGYPSRLGTNAAWNHFGNGATAVLGGVIGWFHGIVGVFFVMAGMAALSLICLAGIRPEHIDHDVARGLKDGRDSEDRAAAPAPFKLLFSSRSLFAVALVVAFFHFGNAAMLPLLGQSAVARFDSHPAAYTAATVLVAQAVMLITALLGARMAERRGYGMLFLIALPVLILRGLTAGFLQSEWALIPVQILDGVGNGLMGVATPGIVARLLRGGGHVNLGLGVVLTLKEIGASFSNAYGGIVAHHAGYGMAFLALAAAPCVGLILWLAAVRLPALASAAAPFTTRKE